MSRRLFAGLFLAGLLTACAAASLERSPGYMDADYYYAGALRLAEGWGATEPYLWNYLNDPGGLPAPAFAYWMPLTSLVAAAGIYLAPALGFWGARLGFLLLAALVPPLTALIAASLDARPAQARLAGLLALFPGFYLAYLPTTDAFALYMVLGGLFVLLASGRSRLLAARWPEAARLLTLGITAGLLHFTRADGVLWLAGGLAAAGLLAREECSQRPDSRFPALAARAALRGLPVLAGYGLVMLPWFARNLNAWGSLFPPGGSRAAWVTSYNEMMVYPASLLTPQHWWAAGPGAHITARLEALSTNLQTTLAIQGGIVLLPFILAGLWLLRRCLPVRLGALMWLLTAGLMTFIFPFAGINGGFFHAGSALQPLWWAAAPLGIDHLMTAYARWRRLPNPRAVVNFTSVLLVAVAVVLSGLLYFQRVVGSGVSDNESEALQAAAVPAGVLKWNASADHYRAVEQALAGLGAAPCETVLVNNPPGFWLASRRPAVVIPYGDETALLDAARRFDARYVILETANSGHLPALYSGAALPTGLEYMMDVGSTRLYRVVEAD